MNNSGTTQDKCIKLYIFNISVIFCVQITYFENLQKILRLAGGQIQWLPVTRKMTPKIHQKNQRDLNAWEQPSVDFFSENSNKVPI